MLISLSFVIHLLFSSPFCVLSLVAYFAHPVPSLYYSLLFLFLSYISIFFSLVFLLLPVSAVYSALLLHFLSSYSSAVIYYLPVLSFVLNYYFVSFVLYCPYFLTLSFSSIFFYSALSLPFSVSLLHSSFHLSRSFFFHVIFAAVSLVLAFHCSFLFLNFSCFLLLLSFYFSVSLRLVSSIISLFRFFL